MVRDMEQAKANTRKRYAANPEKFRVATRARYQKNKAACIASAAAWQKANPDKVKATVEKYAFPRRLKRYGLTEDQYCEFIIEQENKCAGCRCDRDPDKEWHIDHCHVTNKVRGLLCGSCNKALGLVKDNVETLRRMATYLEEAK